MVVSIDVKHVFRHPLHLVVNTHLTKYPTDKDRFVHKVETVERTIDWTKGIDYRRRLAFCENVVPKIMRKISILQEQHLILEEEAWLNLHNGKLDLKSRNITWSKYADMREESKFIPSADNPNWTLFVQHGQIDIKHLGPLGRVLEMFAEKILHIGVQRTLRVMDELLNERSTQEIPDT